MKSALILNGLNPAYPERARELAAWTRDRLRGPDRVETAVILADLGTDSKPARRRLAAELSARRAVVLDIGGPYQAEKALAALPEFCADLELMLFPGDFSGAELAVRLAHRLAGVAVTGTLAAAWEDGAWVVEKMVYSQHLRAAFKPRPGPVCLALAPGAAEPAARPAGPGPTVTVYDRRGSGGAEFVLETRVEPESESEDLARAKRLVVAGQGVGGREGVAAAARLAEAMSADWGVSRPAAMNAWAPLARLVGVSGAMTRPELCLAVGVSGSPALYAGLEKSRFLVAVNHDPQAPMVRGADVAVIDDCGPVMAELTRLLKE